jgi:hypothetical protein
VDKVLEIALVVDEECSVSMPGAGSMPHVRSTMAGQVAQFLNR